MKLQVVISKTGSVDSVNVVSGHPLLVQGAINAVEQWQYKPFLADGEPVTFSTEVEVPFSLGISEATDQAEQKNDDDHFKCDDEYRNLAGGAGLEFGFGCPSVILSRCVQRCDAPVAQQRHEKPSESRKMGHPADARLRGGDSAIDVVEHRNAHHRRYT